MSRRYMNAGGIDRIAPWIIPRRNYAQRLDKFDSYDSLMHAVA